MARKSKRKTSSYGEDDHWLSSPRFALVLTGVILGFALLLPYTLSSWERDEPFLVDASRILLETRPRWFGAETAESIERSVSGLGQVSLRDDESLEHLIAEVAESSGWIERVEKVVKHYPDSLEIHVELRTPVARVAGASREFLVDDRGRVLGRSEEAPELIRDRRLPLIHVPAGPSEYWPGQQINEPVLRQALDVAAEIEPFREDLARREIRIAVIDASPLADQWQARLTDFNLYTPDGLCIEWGRAQSSPRLAALEPSPETKIANLVRASLAHEGFEGVDLVRVQFEKSFSIEGPIKESGRVSRSDAYRDNQ